MKANVLLTALRKVRPLSRNYQRFCRVFRKVCLIIRNNPLFQYSLPLFQNTATVIQAGTAPALCGAVMNRNVRSDTFKSQHFFVLKNIHWQESETGRKMLSNTSGLTILKCTTPVFYNPKIHTPVSYTSIIQHMYFTIPKYNPPVFHNPKIEHT